MKAKIKSIGSFEAKTHLSGLIEEVRSGAEYVITKRGKPVARLVPYEKKGTESGINEIIMRFDEIRNSVRGKVNIREFIKEGRK